MNNLGSVFASVMLLSAAGAERASAEPVAAAKLYAQICGSCHVTQGPPKVAPPIFAVKAHVLQIYPGRDEFIDYVTQWVDAPDASKTLMPGAVRRFGVMPTLGYDPAAVRQVAAYLFDTALPEPPWFRSHYEAEHGRQPRR